MKWRIWLLSITTMLVCVVVFCIATTSVYYNSSIDDGKEYLKVYMNEFDATKYSFDETGAKSFSEKLNGARVTFMDSQGNVEADSLADNTERNHSDREEIIDALKGGLNGEGYAVRSSSTLGKNMLYYCRNFNGEYLVRIAIFTDTAGTIFVRTLPTMLYFLLFMSVVCVVIAIVATNFIVTPVKKLAKQAIDNDNVATNYDELKPIAEILNERSRNIKRQMDALQSEKLLVEQARETKDVFISNVTHEMNTPLTSIHGYAELLQANGEGMTEEQKSMAYQTILTQSERLTNLIACILNYSEIDNDELPSYEVDFSSLAKETLSAIKPEADKRNVTIEAHIDDNVILLSRQERLNEIFGNLVRNAIKYNVDGGKIIITLNRQCLAVADTGIGISAENKEKVFDRFFTVDKSHNGKNGGFGLGLAVVKKICNKSGWRFSLDSELGKGSTFTITF